MGTWDPSRPNAGRSGARWRACRLVVIERDEGVCHICGHAGADEADHHPLSRGELRAHGYDPDDPAHSKAAHGTRGCPYCPRRPDGRPRRCNQQAGDRGARRRARPVDRGIVTVDPATI